MFTQDYALLGRLVIMYANVPPWHDTLLEEGGEPKVETENSSESYGEAVPISSSLG